MEKPIPTITFSRSGSDTAGKIKDRKTSRAKKVINKVEKNGEKWNEVEDFFVFLPIQSRCYGNFYW
jgi:hypothetical protein